MSPTLGVPLAFGGADGSLERTLAVIRRSAELQDASALRLAICGELGTSKAMVLRGASARHAAERVAHARVIRALRAESFALADAERRRIADDLHDGAQQHLTVLGIRLAELAELIDEDPASAKPLATRLIDEVDEAISELRRLVHGVYPAVLTDHGLVPALRAVARDLPTPTTVHGRRICRYREAVESSVYFTCVEALQNAVKHAPDATAITLKLAARAGRLEFDVADNGSGLAAGAHPGHGFASMQARMTSVAGVLTIESAPGAGTHVAGSVPVDGGAAGNGRPVTPI